LWRVKTSLMVLIKKTPPLEPSASIMARLITTAAESVGVFVVSLNVFFAAFRASQIDG